jgi:hypothetical protein
MQGRLIIAAALSALTPALMQGQPSVEQLLRPGSRVEYVLRESSIAFRGTLQQVDTGSILVLSDGIDAPIQLGLDTLGALKVSPGRYSRLHGALHGLAKGLSVGIVIAFVPLGPVPALAVTTVGIVMGAVSPGEIWHDVPLPGRRPPPGVERLPPPLP